MSLEYEKIARLRKIFTEKNWPLVKQSRSMDQYFFDKFSMMLSMLGDKEADLLLDLTEQFDKYNFDGMTTNLMVALDLAGISVFEGVESIFVFPMVDPSEADQNKSGSSLVYPFIHSVLDQRIRHIPSAPQVHNYKALHAIKRHGGRGRSLVIGIDDFIGSGSTAKKFIQEYEKQCQTERDNLLILTAAAMEKAFNEIISLGYNIFTGVVYTRGVSDSPIIADKQKALEMIDNIESLIDVELGCNRGYNGCEALVSFIRTPDNTFPMYWSRKRKNGEDWPCPFPR